MKQNNFAGSCIPNRLSGSKVKDMKISIIVAVKQNILKLVWVNPTKNIESYENVFCKKSENFQKHFLVQLRFLVQIFENNPQTFFMGGQHGKSLVI